jgi:multiple sugar transport system permease protein
MDVASTPAVPVKKRFSRKKKNDYMWFVILTLPTVGGLLIFYIAPFFQTLYNSFNTIGNFGNMSWAGIANYQRLFHDANIGAAFRNTLIYTVFSVPIGLCFSILLAVLLNAKIRGRSVYRTLFFLPSVTMPAAIAMVWKWLYNSDYGLINYVLKMLGIQGPHWLSDPNIALYSIILVAIWSSAGYNMIILLAGLQGIPASYYEAGDIDGANAVHKFFNITIPLLTPTIFFVLIMALIGAFQVFDLIFMMISDSSVVITTTQSVVYLFYKNAFILFDKGYASAIAIVLFAVIMIITAIQMKLQDKWVNYD